MIQIPMRCKHYTKNENMNKTCKGENMCKIYYDEECKEYEDENSNSNPIDNCNGSNSDFYSVFE